MRATLVVLGLVWFAHGDRFRDDFCKAVTGEPSAACSTTESLCRDGNTTSLLEDCSEGTVEWHAARFRALRGELFSLMPQKPKRGSFDFVDQLLAEDYQSFLTFQNGHRLLRSQDVEALRRFFGDSAVRAFRILTELFLTVAGADWVEPVYEPVCERLVTHAGVGVLETILPAHVPSDEVRLRGLKEPQTDWAPSGTFRRALVRVWASATVRTLVRFTDAEHLDYVKALTEANFIEDDNAPAQVAEWLYLLVTRTSLYLRPPAQARRIKALVLATNAEAPAVDLPDGSLTDGLLRDEALSEEEFFSAAQVFWFQTDVLVYTTAQRVSGIRLLERMAGLLGFETVRIFDLIPREWRDWATSFTPKEHHMLDAVLCVASVLAVSKAASMDTFLAILKAARLLGLERIERRARALRTDTELRFVRPPLAHYEIDREEFASLPLDRRTEAYPVHIQKAIIYMRLYARVAELNMEGLTRPYNLNFESYV